MATQVGLKIFEVAFKGFEDQYVLIGGSATQLAMEQFLDQAKDESIDLSGLNHPKGSNLADVLNQIKQAFL